MQNGRWTMKRRFWCVVGALILSLPAMASATDSPVYQCPGPSGTLLYTDRELSDCRPITLSSLTIAPSRTYSESVSSPSYNRLRPFPADWYDHSAPVGSMRNRLMQGGLYGMQNWIDYDSPVGSMRNSVGTWPRPFGFGLYGW
jgi:hypothetical protein